jgi:signal transduction histidine kinase
MSPRPYKILYIEDNPMNRDLVRRVLTHAGYTMYEAADGLSGIQVAERERPDLILMDIMLPEMDGHHVTTRLKSTPKLARTPIVALTAKATEGDRERALIAGCDGYIPKPIDVDLLPQQIEEFLKGKREEIPGSPEERLTLQQEYTRELVAQLEARIRDLQQANAELRRTDELKSKFISMASHELRTPLAVIQGYLTILQTQLSAMDVPINETARLSLAGLDKGVARLKTIVEDMLDVVRIEGKTFPVHREPTVIKETVMAAIRKLERDAQARQLTIRVDPMEGLPVIRADGKCLKQVFFNLLSNAIKYTPDGGRIDISVNVTRGIELARYDRPTSSSGDFLHIVFQDTGVGIAPEEQERIFDLFYEVRDPDLHSTSKTSFMGSGLGLGLAIARGIVEAHGGFLWAESEGFDKEKCPGSRLHVLLPIEE